MVWLRVHLFWILVGIAFVWIHTTVQDRRDQRPKSPHESDCDERPDH